LRILFLGNNWVGWQIARWLIQQQENIVGLVLHPPSKRKYGEEILRDTAVNSTNIFDGSKLQQPSILKNIKELQPDIALSVMFGYILKPEFIQLFPQGVINLHPSLLPYNRGANPNVWSIVEQTPAGVTLHYIDTDIDTGDIIAQQMVAIEPVDTGETVYRKLERASVSLFKNNWASIRGGQVRRRQQSKEAGTFHRVKDLDLIDCIDLDRQYTARDLINILRARTFPPYPGAYFVENGRKVYMRLQLMYEEELANE